MTNVEAWRENQSYLFLTEESWQEPGQKHRWTEETEWETWTNRWTTCGAGKKPISTSEPSISCLNKHTVREPSGSWLNHMWGKRVEIMKRRWFWRRQRKKCSEVWEDRDRREEQENQIQENGGRNTRVFPSSNPGMSHDEWAAARQATTKIPHEKGITHTNTHTRDVKHSHT